MITTKNRAEEVRAFLDNTQPGWQERVRAELDALTPNWESFPLMVWDEESSGWVEVVLLANPERIARPKVNFMAKLRQWFGRN